MNEDFKKKKSEYLLELALEEQLENDPEILNFKSEDELETPHVFSKEHEKKMKEIFRAASRAERKAKNRKYFQRMAAGVAIMLCLSGFTVMNVEAFRVPVVEFLLDISEKYTLLQPDTNSQTLTKNFQIYEPTYVPVGFQVVELSEIEDRFSIDYSTEEQLWYTLIFCYNSRPLSIDTENTSLETYTINGNKAVIIEKNGILNIIMYSGNSYYELMGNISYDEANKILKSIK